MSDSLVLEIIVALCGGFGVYAAIRADLARMHERITAHHERLDDHKKRLDRIEFGD